MTLIAPLITAFLRDRLAIERGTSQHTCDTYAYAFKLLFEFAAHKLKLTPSKLCLEHINAPLVLAFLEHIEKSRNNSPLTRNGRLAAIKSFMRFVEYRIPSALKQVHSILAIPAKKTDTRLVPYLSKEEIQALLDAPDPTTRLGIRNRAMLHLGFAAGLRVSELVGLCMGGLTLHPSPTILVLGKGRRQRALPLWKETTAALRAWLAIRPAAPVPEVFLNARGKQISRWGFEHILRTYVKAASNTCPSILNKKISPHVLRHTCAMVMLQATRDIRKVSLWLGHSSIQTTEIYLQADPSEKLEAINAITPPALRRGTFRPPDKLIAFLTSGRAS